MPVPRFGLPWMVDEPQASPVGPGTPSALREAAMARGEAPAALRLARGPKATDDIIAIGIAAARPARLDAAAQAAPRLVGEVLEEELVHRAFEADVELVDLALGQGDDGT